jgi:hypothetical protein
MTYFLIFDLSGGNTAGRRRVNRHLARVARRVQQSVWEFRDMRTLRGAAELIASVGGRTIAFIKSDRLLLNVSEVRQTLEEMSYVRHRGRARISNV